MVHLRGCGRLVGGVDLGAGWEAVPGIRVEVRTGLRSGEQLSGTKSKELFSPFSYCTAQPKLRWISFLIKNLI